MPQFIHNMGKNSALCVNFVASSFYVVFAKSFIYAQKYVALAKLYVALADSPFDLYYWAIFRHDFSLGSNFHKVPYELNIHGADYHKYILYFIINTQSKSGGAVVLWSVHE